MVKTVFNIQLQWENSAHEQSNHQLWAKEPSFFSELLRSLPAKRAVARPCMFYIPEWSGASGQ